MRELKSKRLRREQWRDRYATVENGQLRIFDKKGVRSHITNSKKEKRKAST